MGAGVEHGEVEGILSHLKGVVVASDIAWVDATGKIEEDVGANDSDGRESAVERCKERPGTGKEHVFTAGEESKEEYDDGRVAVVKHVVAKTLEVAGQTAPGDDAVESENAGRNGVPYEVV